jgi:hypothetical protein
LRFAAVDELFITIAPRRLAVGREEFRPARAHFADVARYLRERAVGDGLAPSEPRNGSSDHLRPMVSEKR